MRRRSGGVRRVAAGLFATVVALAGCGGDVAAPGGTEGAQADGIAEAESGSADTGPLHDTTPDGAYSAEIADNSDGEGADSGMGAADGADPADSAADNDAEDADDADDADDAEDAGTAGDHGSGSDADAGGTSADVAPDGDAAGPEEVADAIVADAGDAADGVAADAGGDAGPDADAQAPPKCVVPSTKGHHAVKCLGFVFDLHIPASCPAQGCGLVVDVHGLTMSAEMQDANTGMRALGDQHGYVVIQPNANPAPPAASWQPSGDDAAVLTFTKDAIAVLKIDSKRVHFTGFSQGGMMSWRMICQHAQLFASVAPAAAGALPGANGCAFTGAQMPSQQLPVLFMHGKKDVLQAFGFATAQVDSVVKAWSLKKSSVVAQDAHHLWQRYVSPQGTVFEFIEHDYAAKSALLGGHCYPGSLDQKGGKSGQLFAFGCVDQAAFAWGQAAMAFFIAHPKP